MPGKRVQFDDDVEGMETVIRNRGSSFQELADEALGGSSKET